jgi:ABC-type transport system involved in multi-copper enzyme maturation permease subunit
MRLRWRPPPVIGPLFGYDLVASTRRGQHNGLRVLMAVLLLITLYVVYMLQVRGFDPFVNPFDAGPRISPKEMQKFAHDFATGCMIVQFAAVILITPVVVADAIARDKERRALDFLFVTELTDREIVLGKFGSRLAYMGGVVLTGLPILALVVLFGGVEPELLFTSYAAVLATLVSLGSLSLYCSVVSNTAVQATMRAYLAAVGYLLIAPCVLFSVASSDWAVSGMLFYIGFNLLLTVVLVVVSIHDLRPRAELLAPARPAAPVRFEPASPKNLADDELPFVLPAKPAAATPIKPALPALEPVDWRQLDRPPVWEPPELPRGPLPPVDERRPFLWKEIYLHSIAGAAPGGPTAMAVLLMLAASFAGFLWVVLAVNPAAAGDVTSFGNGAVKVATLLLGGLIGLGSIVHTVNSVSKEVEKDTLDGLLTLPIGRAALLSAKWLGGLASLRVLAVALACIWLFGLLTGGLHPLAAAALAISVAAVVEFLSSLGLWLSVVCKTSLRANMAAVLCLLLVAFGPWIVSNYLDLIAPYSAVSRFLAAAVVEAAMPTEAWRRLCVSLSGYSSLPDGYFPTILLGALFYAMAAWSLWRAALSRFRRYGGKPPAAGSE